MRRTQIYLEDEQHALLRERAEREGTTVSDVIRRAVDAALARGPDAETWRTRWLEALEESGGVAADLPAGREYVDEIRASERARRRDAATDDS